ncbi:PREDICTED: tRNA dimethylallyltransferase 2 [Tarenaya hassleriana]|uniref:tRNA dimethylallyltransferase 2 n=1 Tax=Tarenaya hassleriana TaxID=28532 RepID=UPI00053C8EB7|nr:PREDICTED: tRNA dimethylallyltransferase 2 [Tarenaya hassleriana]XP_010521681.1 PREDICTED: tRNA dimethylallyltransferase 2 [Tarenaya hassleriana]
MADSREEVLLNPSNGGIDGEKTKTKVVVVMGPTGSGKSKLAVDLASHFPIEIINADAMQVYSGLDVLTNKVPLDEQKGVPHHLLGTVSPDTEFTAKDFRDSTIPLIEEIQSRNNLPVLVGGTNYYIQAVVSRFLLDDSVEDTDERCSNDAPEHDDRMDIESFSGRDDLSHGYDLLKELDPAAANRIHPNNARKIQQYLSLYARQCVLPSKLFQGKTAENWGRVDNSQLDCCFICIDVAFPVLDRYVEQRVDCMVESGLLDEVYDIYKPGADYTRGLRQAIGVREFEDFLKIYLSDTSSDGKKSSPEESVSRVNGSKDDNVRKENLRDILNFPKENKLRVLLEEAIDRIKLNTRRLLRRQKRRVGRLETLFGWKIYYIDATESISSKSEESWAAQVVRPASEIIRSFLNGEATSVSDAENHKGKSVERDLWTQYVCEACGHKVLRGSHEWEEHRRGRAHRKRSSTLKKARALITKEKQEEMHKLI